MIKMEGNNYNQRCVVHLPDDICRTLTGQGHSGMEPKVIIYDDYNSKVVDGGIIGTLTCNCGISTLRNGFKIIETK